MESCTEGGINSEATYKNTLAARTTPHTPHSVLLPLYAELMKSRLSIYLALVKGDNQEKIEN